MAGPSWNYVLKFIITGAASPLPPYYVLLNAFGHPLPGDAGVGKSSLLIRLTDQRFLANPDPTVRLVPSRPRCCPHLIARQARRRIRLQAYHYTRGGQSR